MSVPTAAPPTPAHTPDDVVELSGEALQSWLRGELQGRDPGDVVYRGLAGGRRVVVETLDGARLGDLPHVVRHSPLGFGWGYHGAGPADLARSLLIHALAADARCPVCSGSGRVVWPSVDATVAVPFDPTNELHAALAAWDPAEGEIPGASDATRSAVLDPCLDCDGSGLRALPYQAFKLEVVAGWPRGGGWTLKRADVLSWLRTNRFPA